MIEIECHRCKCAHVLKDASPGKMKAYFMCECGELTEVMVSDETINKWWEEADPIASRWREDGGE